MQNQTENMIGMDPIVCLYGVPEPEPKKQVGLLASIGLATVAVVIGIVVVIKKKFKRKKEK